MRSGSPAAAVLLALSLAASGCAGPSPQTWHERWGVPLDEVSAILHETACADLEQVITHLVHGITERPEEAGQGRVLVHAAFHRMVELGCRNAYRK